jgi:hypothetical protein
VHVTVQEQRGRRWPILGGILSLLVVVALCAGGYYLLFGRGDDDEAEVEEPPTAVAGVPLVTAVTDVNIRSGPSADYATIGLIKQGQTAEVIGVSPDGGWWVIKFPGVTESQGWVSGQYTTAENTANIPVVNPPVLTPVPPEDTAVPPTAEPTLPPPTAQPTLEPPPVEPTQPPLPTATLDDGAGGAPPGEGEQPEQLPADEQEVTMPSPPPDEEAEVEPVSEEDEDDSGGLAGICSSPAILVLAGLVLVPLSRRRFRQ